MRNAKGKAGKIRYYPWHESPVRSQYGPNPVNHTGRTDILVCPPETDICLWKSPCSQVCPPAQTERSQPGRDRDRRGKGWSLRGAKRRSNISFRTGFGG